MNIIRKPKVFLRTLYFRLKSQHTRHRTRSASPGCCDMFTNSLPHEIIIKIIAYLDVKHVLKLARVNKKLHDIAQDSYVWRGLCGRRFGYNVLDQEKGRLLQDQDAVKAFGGDFKGVFQTPNSGTIDWKRVYLRWSLQASLVSRKDTSIVNFMDIPWDNVEESTSIYGKALKLKVMPWTLISVRIRNVPAGQYDVLWRIKGDDEFCKNVDRVFFRTYIFAMNPDMKQMYELSRRWNHSSDTMHKEWFETCTVKKITVPRLKSRGGKKHRQSCNLEFRIAVTTLFDGAASWYFDYIRLRPCS